MTKKYKHPKRARVGNLSTTYGAKAKPVAIKAHKQWRIVLPNGGVLPLRIRKRNTKHLKTMTNPVASYACAVTRPHRVASDLRDSQRMTFKLAQLMGKYA